ncbi:MAG: YggT family protein [bacterium]|nr:YggT family protein [bacterium]
MLYSVLAPVILLIFKIMYFALFARIIISWIPHNHYHPIVNFLYKITDPILKPFQKLHFLHLMHTIF